MTIPDIEAVLSGHERAKDLQSKSQDVQFSRMVLNIPEEDQPDNFTTGTLATQQCFAAIPAVATSRSEKTMVAVYYLGKGFTGHKGYVHGGVTATMLDECSGRAALCHFEAQKEGGELGLSTMEEFLMMSFVEANTRSAAVTAQLSISYLAPIKTDSCVMVQAEVSEEGLSKRKAKVSAKLWSLGDGGDVLAASAESLFIEPKI